MHSLGCFTVNIVMYFFLKTKIGTCCIIFGEIPEPTVPEACGLRDGFPRPLGSSGTPTGLPGPWGRPLGPWVSRVVTGAGGASQESTHASVARLADFPKKYTSSGLFKKIHDYIVLFFFDEDKGVNIC